jgi:hypothetical protein
VQEQNAVAVSLVAALPRYDLASSRFPSHPSPPSHVEPSADAPQPDEQLRLLKSEISNLKSLSPLSVLASQAFLCPYSFAVRFFLRLGDFAALRFPPLEELSYP